MSHDANAARTKGPMALLLAALLFHIAAPAVAQTVPAPNDPAAIKLGTGGVPNAKGPEIWSRQGGKLSVRNVTEATLTPVLPPKDKATGAAVVVAPGGAFRTLAMDQEGWPVARWLADHGIAAFVLKYRLVPTSPSWPEFGREMAEVMRKAAPGPDQHRALPTPPYAVDDGLAAIRLIRARAAEFGVDPKRVGMMGFSAGAITTIATAQQADAAAMPAFIAPIYPSMGRVEVPANAPPMFVALAVDDPLLGRMGYGLVESWIAARGKVELHAYQRGGHGYGVGIAGTTTEGWLESFRLWLAMNGMLKAS
ncbi:alpha/beta hydrolase fold [Sphingomonas laterariae]|uniref:Alpha/beta hydrolase fold n=1 Tax=Edaphosphingomonas laterariae TaxID=861865 RepID=A0A239DGY8_9SPHN|nr:alpha/beta hydrolase [Sphingomonas laterariae]SNS31088.1 alpha/beta hydrolase fold [Sphingomonas laterariae]